MPTHEFVYTSTPKYTHTNTQTHTNTHSIQKEEHCGTVYNNCNESCSHILHTYCGLRAHSHTRTNTCTPNTCTIIYVYKVSRKEASWSLFNNCSNSCFHVWKACS